MKQPFTNKIGITIKELKNLIKDLPESDDYGNEYELWVENTDDDGLSNPARSITQLNQGDLLISIRPE